MESSSVNGRLSRTKDLERCGPAYQISPIGDAIVAAFQWSNNGRLERPTALRSVCHDAPPGARLRSEMTPMV